ncbi:hypothetical protein [Streptomyces wedmorensis]
MAYDVGDRLLDDAERGPVDGFGQRAGRAPATYLHADAGVRRRRDQPVEVGEPRERCGLRHGFRSGVRAAQ